MKKSKKEYELILENYKDLELAPSNMTLEAFMTLQGCLYESSDGRKETPVEMYRRVAEASAKYLYKHPRIAEDFFYLISNNFLGLATPVAANLGTPANSLPISCYVIEVQDSVDGIFGGLYRAAKLTKGGGGVGIGLGSIRPQGSNIKGGGKSNGAKPWATIYDFASRIVSQAGVRRGQFSFYFDIESPDLWDFLLAKDHSKGDPRTHIHSNIAVNIRNSFMKKLINGDTDAIEIWNAVLRTRIKSGSPYLHFIDNANDGLVDCMKLLGKKITGSNICTEISSCADENHDMVCCLASMNLYRYNEWKHWEGKYGNAVETAIYFLDGVMENFIQDSINFKGTELAREYAIKGRPLGLGVFGQHAFYMKNGWAFKSQEARDFNKCYHMLTEISADRASMKLAEAYGTCEWASSSMRRNIQTTSIAPTVGNSVTNMGITPGIEPIAGHYYEAKGAAGSFMRKNPILEEYLESINKNTYDVWDSILKNKGSVQHLDFLDEEEKEVFKTFSEIDQREIILQASVRQKYLEQTQSINLSFEENADPEYISDVHIMAHQAKLHTLYYLRSESIGKNSLIENKNNDDSSISNVIYTVVTKSGCSWCEKTITLLENNGYRVLAVDKDSEEGRPLCEITSKEGWNTYPRIFRGSEFIGGYQQLAASLYNVTNIQESQEICSSCDG